MRAQDLVGCVLAAGERRGKHAAEALVAQAKTVLRPEMMGADAKTWAAIVRLAERGEPITTVAVAREAGIAPSKVAVRYAGSVPIDHAAEAAERIAREFTREAMFALADRIRDEAARVMEGARSYDEAIDGASQLVLDLRSRIVPGRVGVDGAEMIDAGLRHLREFREAGPSRVTAGLGPEFDEDLGGYRRGCLYVWGYRTSEGKTVMALQQALENAILGRRVAVFSLEMDPAGLGERAISYLTRQSKRTILDQLDEGEFQSALSETAAGLASKIRVFSDARMTTDEIRDAARGMQLDGGVDLVIVDHVQIVAPARATRERYREIGAITEELVVIAKTLKVPVVMMTQLNPPAPGEKDVTPRWEQIRESRDVALHATAIMLGWTKWENGRPLYSRLKVDKNRYGVRGRTYAVEFHAGRHWFEFKGEDVGAVEIPTGRPLIGDHGD